MFAQAVLAPGPRPHPLFGHVTAFRKDPFGFLTTAIRDYGDIVGLRLGPRPALFLRHPDHIQVLLQAHRDNYVKQPLFRVVFGDGVATANGAAWHRQRRLLTPWFHPRRVSGAIPVLHDVLNDLVRRWRLLADSAQPVELLVEMRRLALLFVARTLLGAELGSAADGIRRAADLLQRGMAERLFRLVRLPLWVPTPGNRTFLGAVRALDQLAYGLIAERRTARGTSDDLFRALLEADGTPASDRAVRDQVLTLLFAAYENTGNALTWLCYVLARHREVEERVHDELLATCDGGLPNGEALAQLRYTRMVVDETLRLYPTGWIVRVSRAEDMIGAYRVPASTVVFVSPYLTHRHPQFWPNPERFDPARFAAGTAPFHAFSYLPFGEGPRQCPGGDYAVVESLLTVAAVVGHFRLRLVAGQSLEPDPLFSVAPRHGLKVILQSRGNH
ncbi:MAG: cytochrome P450 [Gemmatimonadota bacterium]